MCRFRTCSRVYREIFQTEIVVEEQEIAECKSGDNGAAYYPPKQTPPPAPADSTDGFMNIPDGIEEELPFN